MSRLDEDALTSNCDKDLSGFINTSVRPDTPPSAARHVSPNYECTFWQCFPLDLRYCEINACFVFLVVYFPRRPSSQFTSAILHQHHPILKLSCRRGLKRGNAQSKHKDNDAVKMLCQIVLKAPRFGQQQNYTNFLYFCVVSRQRGSKSETT